MTLHRLFSSGPEINEWDFVARADMIGGLGHSVIVSNFARCASVPASLRRYKAMDRLRDGLATLGSVFDETYHADLPGGILEGLGLVFQGNVRMYVCPTRNRAGQVATSSACGPFKGLGRAFYRGQARGTEPLVNELAHMG
jgi:hypothetical protein